LEELDRDLLLVRLAAKSLLRERYRLEQHSTRVVLDEMYFVWRETLRQEELLVQEFGIH
jgi:hypothetical protein